MELSMQDNNGNTLLHSNSEANGCDTTTNVSNTNEHNTSQQTYDPTIVDKVVDETTANGTYDPPQPRLKNEDKTLHDPTHTPSGPKAGTSPPTEHKQHLHLPLRKRHLLASSTGSHHSESLGDSNHVIPTQITGQPQDMETTPSSTNNISTELETHQANMTIPIKPTEPTPTEHTDPPDPPEPPETTNKYTEREPDSTKVGNGDRGAHTKHEHKEYENDVRVQDSLAHDTTNPLNNKRPQFHPSHHHTSQQPFTTSRSSPPPPQNSQHPHHTQNLPQQPKLPPAHAHSSPTRTNSPTGAQSPTRAHSPSAQSGRHSSSRGRGSGRGRGKSTKTEGLSTSANVASSSSGEELYCFCRRPYDPTVDVFMICCDSCDEWYHGSCVGINQREAKKIARYVCPRCKKMPTSPTTTSATSSGSEGEPSTPPTNKNKKRKNETSSFKTEPKRQALSPSMSDNGVDTAAGPEESRYCLNCNKQALPKSKYCGQDCGLEYARKLVYHNNGSKKPSSATEIADREALDEIARKKSDIAEKLNKLGKEQRDLEKAIQLAKMDSISVTTTRSTSPTMSIATDLLDEPASKNHISASENTTIDCISCGHPIAVSKYTLHMERCYHKKENNVLMVGATADGGAIYCNAFDSKTKTYCKKLKNACALHASKRQVGVIGETSSATVPNSTPLTTNGSVARRSSPLTCGCPTSDFQSGYCELPRKACVKHHNWEELMRDSISNQRTQHNKILAGLEAEENAVRLRMTRRSQAAGNSYRTIEEA